MRGVITALTRSAGAQLSRLALVAEFGIGAC
jgi:hypothetical protein